MPKTTRAKSGKEYKMSVASCWETECKQLQARIKELEGLLDISVDQLEDADIKNAKLREALKGIIAYIELIPRNRRNVAHRTIQRTAKQALESEE